MDINKISTQTQLFLSKKDNIGRINTRDKLLLSRTANTVLASGRGKSKKLIKEREHALTTAAEE